MTCGCGSGRGGERRAGGAYCGHFTADLNAGLPGGEGAATLILEELEHARTRGARIHAEVIGYPTNCDGQHITNPDASGMQRVIELALDDARLEPVQIEYVNAHGTATEAGDIAETSATAAVLGPRVPISSLKSFMGHTLGACGAIEAWLSIEMLREGWFAPTLNLERVDPRCAELDYIRGELRALAARVGNFYVRKGRVGGEPSGGRKGIRRYFDALPTHFSRAGSRRIPPSGCSAICGRAVAACATCCS